MKKNKKVRVRKVRVRKRRQMHNRPKKHFRHVLYNFQINRTPQLICSGDYAIYSNTIGCIRPAKMEVLKLWLNKELKKYKAHLFVRCVYDKPFTKKAKQARMGKSKGKIDHYFATVHENDVLLEIRKPTLEELMRLKKKGRSVSGLEESDRKKVDRLMRRLQFRFSLGITTRTLNYGLCTNQDVRNG